MIVVLAAEVFEAKAVSRLDLMALLQACRGDPHAVVLDPPYDPAAPPPGFDSLGVVCEEVVYILECGAEAAASSPKSRARIRVQSAGPSSYGGPLPFLTVFDATRMLSRPLHILVENRRNDGAFLRKVIPPERRRDFEYYERRGYIRIDSEGGLGEMTKRVEALQATPEEVGRYCLIFDRDCRDQDPKSKTLVPSPQAQALVKRCAAIRDPWPLRHHMLERRAIENYLPLSALFGWAGADRGRADLAEAYRDLAVEQMCCFPMKKGLLGDVSTNAERERLEQANAPIEDKHLATIFKSLDRGRRERLRRGFGADVAGLFHDEGGVARVHDPDISKDERLAIVQLIDDRL